MLGITLHTSWRLISLATALSFLGSCSSRHIDIAAELEAAIGTPLIGEYVILKTSQAGGIGDYSFSADVELTALGHERALAAVPEQVRNKTATGFQVLRHRSVNGTDRLTIASFTDHNRTVALQVIEE